MNRGCVGPHAALENSRDSVPPFLRQWLVSPACVFIYKSAKSRGAGTVRIADTWSRPRAHSRCSRELIPGTEAPARRLCPSAAGRQVSPQTGRRRGGAAGGPHLAAAPPGGGRSRPPRTPRKPGAQALASPGPSGKRRPEPRGGEMKGGRRVRAPAAPDEETEAQRDR
ncbi:myosin IC heavy chain-like [Neofelis nebulosa]|uniref:myosin IC heavy chain-like n=1 Tax=Neofelis nebulosa TaxID=61452 RepID=UPI00272AD7E5|nr:myosin IC heavy chain-like [Neofelis nebulosa]